jgi:hypothetical protein
MNENQDPDLLALAERCKAQWETHVRTIDPVISVRLARARAAALSAGFDGKTARPFRVPGVWLPVAVCAFAGALAVAVWVSRPVAVSAPMADAAPVEDAELLASGDEPDLYTEDAAFYEWAGSEIGAS